MDYRFRLYFASLAVAAIAGLAFSQTPDEHASHHPSPGAASSGSASPKSPADTTADTTMGTPGNPPEAAMGGMGGGMGEMMKQMGKPPRKELYPSLMALPDDVTAEERAGIEQLARERMEAGTALLSSGLAKLTNSTSNEDYSAMQEAAGQMREGLAEFEAGIAARRVFAEGKAPRNLALDWFKREMNLALPIQPEEPRTFLGVTPFHLFTMAMLVVFALAMIAMYFFKMRRAAALFGRIETDADPAPPVTPPPGGGTPKPRAPAPP